MRTRKEEQRGERKGCGAEKGKKHGGNKGRKLGDGKDGGKQMKKGTEEGRGREGRHE